MKILTYNELIAIDGGIDWSSIVGGIALIAGATVVYGVAIFAGYCIGNGAGAVTVAQKLGGVYAAAVVGGSLMVAAGYIA